MAQSRPANSNEIEPGDQARLTPEATPDSFSNTGTYPASSHDVAAPGDSESTESIADAYTAARSKVEVLELEYMQSLLPETAVIHQLFNYYDKNLLWYHWSISMPLLQEELGQALAASGRIQLQGVDLRWPALVFAILCASLLCSDDITAESWGYSRPEKSPLSKAWFDASLTRLRRSRYTARPHIASVQTILMLTLTAHSLGYTADLFSMLATAMRLAQSLGLHKLSYDEGKDDVRAGSTSQQDQALRREVNRRVWVQLQMHDSYTVAFTDTYLLHPQHSRSGLPRRLEDESLALYDDSSPHPVDWTIWLLQLSKLVTQYHDTVALEPDEDTVYRTTLEFDSEIRGHTLPTSFESHSRNEWARWASQEAVVVRANKLIYIHQRFFRRSFREARYAYARWASVEASRILIQEVTAACSAELKRPGLWNDQAHLLSACVTLCLDFCHQTSTDREFAEHRELLDRAVSWLESKADSVLAQQGVRLVSALLSNRREHLDDLLGASTDERSTDWPSVASEDLEGVRQQASSQLCPTDDHDQGPQPFHDFQDDIFADLSWINMLTENALDGPWLDRPAVFDG